MGWITKRSLLGSISVLSLLSPQSTTRKKPPSGFHSSRLRQNSRDNRAGRPRRKNRELRGAVPSCLQSGQKYGGSVFSQKSSVRIPLVPPLRVPLTQCFSSQKTGRNPLSHSKKFFRQKIKKALKTTRAFSFHICHSGLDPESRSRNKFGMTNNPSL